jgi:hypothetical protein
VGLQDTMENGQKITHAHITVWIKKTSSRVLVAHACNPRYLGGQGSED